MAATGTMPTSSRSSTMPASALAPSATARRSPRPARDSWAVVPAVRSGRASCTRFSSGPLMCGEVWHRRVTVATARKYRSRSPPTLAARTGGGGGSASMDRTNVRTQPHHRPHRARRTRLPDRPRQPARRALAGGAQPGGARRAGRDRRRRRGRQRLPAPRRARIRCGTSARGAPPSWSTRRRPATSTCWSSTTSWRRTSSAAWRSCSTARCSTARR